MEWIGRRFYLFTIRLFLTLFQKEIRNSMRPPKNEKYAKGNISVGDGIRLNFYSILLYSSIDVRFRKI